MTIHELDPPSAEPLTLAEAKAHLRLDTSEEDGLVASLITAARAHLECTAGLALMSRGFRLHLDDWPRDRVIRIAKGPVQTIDRITVYDAVGLPVEQDATGHVLDGTARPARLFLADRLRPGRALNGIEIDFTAGFGEAGTDVPDGLKRALLVHVAAMFDLRGALSIEDQPGAVPAGYDRLVAPFRMRRL